MRPEGDMEMAFFESLHDREKSLTFHKVKGLLSAVEFMSAASVFYSGNTALNVFWDFTEVDLSKISPDELRQIVREIRICANAREGDKTALVFSTDFGYGLGRMIETFSEIENMPFELRSFRSFEKAEEWLGVNIASILIKLKKTLNLTITRHLADSPLGSAVTGNLVGI
jgi:hypothetical protein